VIHSFKYKFALNSVFTILSQVVTHYRLEH